MVKGLINSGGVAIAALLFHITWLMLTLFVLDITSPPDTSGIPFSDGMGDTYKPAYQDHSATYGWTTLLIGWLLVWLCYRWLRQEKLYVEARTLGITSAVFVVPITLIAFAQLVNSMQ